MEDATGRTGDAAPPRDAASVCVDWDGRSSAARSRVMKRSRNDGSSIPSPCDTGRWDISTSNASVTTAALATPAMRRSSTSIVSPCVGTQARTSRSGGTQGHDGGRSLAVRIRRWDHAGSSSSSGGWDRGTKPCSPRHASSSACWSSVNAGGACRSSEDGGGRSSSSAQASTASSKSVGGSGMPPWPRAWGGGPPGPNGGGGRCGGGRDVQQAARPKAMPARARPRKNGT